MELKLQNGSTHPCLASSGAVLARPSNLTRCPRVARDDPIVEGRVPVGGRGPGGGIGAAHLPAESEEDAPSEQSR